MEVSLRRQPSTENGTFGQIFLDGNQICVTCEPQDPIPVGKYQCVPHSGPKFQNVWELQDVPGHTAILIHNGNTINDTHGCILVGSTYGVVDGLPAVLHSVDTLDNLRKLFPDTFEISIYNDPVSAKE